MKTRALLILVLGLWLGGSVVTGAVVSYNFSGFPDLFERNPALAERAGFDPLDTESKKTSLLWVHASELNRVFFAGWNRAQLVLGVLAVVLAVVSRAGRLTAVLLFLALVLVAMVHFGIEPEVVALGRQLDFLPRTPEPPQVAPFQRLHGLYFSTELVRLALVAFAAVRLIHGARTWADGRGPIGS
ncbi:MAG: hypothetical protein ACM3ST_11250 [Bdellovibrio bacteriovorus]